MESISMAFWTIYGATAATLLFYWYVILKCAKAEAKLKRLQEEAEQLERQIEDTRKNPLLGKMVFMVSSGTLETHQIDGMSVTKMTFGNTESERQC